MIVGTSIATVAFYSLDSSTTAEFELGLMWYLLEGINLGG